MPRVLGSGNKAWLIMLVALLWCGLANAQANTADIMFETALRTFRAQDYERALEQFLRARDAGFSRPALNYNLGVTYYKLRRYEEARMAFLKAAAQQATLRALAHYNLGLVAIKQNDPKAEEWFALAIKETTDPKLKSLATLALEQLQAGEAVTSSETTEKWQAILIAGMGFDNNVILRSDRELVAASGQKDNFFDIFANASHKLKETAYGDVIFEGSGYLIHYADLTEYDQSEFSADVHLDTVYRGWISTLGTQLSITYLDNDIFQRKVTLSAGIKQSLENSSSVQFSYDLDRIDEMDSNYAYLEGWAQTFDVRLNWVQAQNRYSFGYMLELNNRADLETPLFASYSPTRQTFYFATALPMQHDMEGKFDLRYRYSRYNDPNELVTGELVTREEERLRLNLGLAFHVSREWDVLGEFSYTNNDSSLSEYSYDRLQYLLSFIYIF